MKKISNIITTSVLLLYFLMGSWESAGLVLCLGENGHISVENPHGEFCNKFSPSTHASKLKKHKNHCVDFALFTGGIEENIIPSKTLEITLTTPAVAVVAGRFTPLLNRAGPEFFILPATTTNNTLDSRRTVVLLI